MCNPFVADRIIASSMDRLSNEDIKDILTRAEELQVENAGNASLEIKSFIQSATEAGYDREAIEKAIQERLNPPSLDVKVGDVVFAASGDGHFYAANVRSFTDSQVDVEFLAGGKASIPRKSVYPLHLTPGTRVVCNWEGFGWWTCTVLNSDFEEMWVKVSDGMGSEETFPIESIRMVKPRPVGAAKAAADALCFKLIMAASTGGIIGALITWMIMRGGL